MNVVFYLFISYLFHLKYFLLDYVEQHVEDNGVVCEVCGELVLPGDKCKCRSRTDELIKGEEQASSSSQRPVVPQDENMKGQSCRFA